jgi:hypothetical protein
VNEDSLALPCPARLRERFDRLPAPHCDHEQTFIRHADRSVAVAGRVWMDATACLGTVNVDSLWTQRRPLLGYWRTPEDPAVVLRVRCLRDGRDWASAALHCSQAGPRALAALGTLADAGDFHLMLDRPADGLFPTRRLSFVCSLDGRGTAGQQLADDLWELSAGDTVALVRTGPAKMAGQPVGWGLTGDATEIRLHATLDFPRVMPLDPHTLEPAVALALTLGSRRDAIPPPPLIHTCTHSGHRWSGGDLSVLVPAAPQSFDLRQFRR